MPGAHGPNYWPESTPEQKQQWKDELEASQTARQKRLDELDRIERDRQYASDDASGALLRFQRDEGFRKFTPKVKQPKKVKRSKKVTLTITAQVSSLRKLVNRV